MKPIYGKAGSEWTPEETEAVLAWLTTPERVDGLIRFAYGFTDDLQLAQDVVAEKIDDALLKYLHTYDPARYRGRCRRPFQNWLYMIIARAAVRAAKREARHREIALVLARAQSQPLQNPPAQPEPKIDWEELLPLVSQLRPKYHQAVQLCIIEEKSRAEAAAIAGCSVGAMKVRLCRACQELRRLREAKESVL